MIETFGTALETEIAYRQERLHDAAAPRRASSPRRPRRARTAAATSPQDAGSN